MAKYDVASYNLIYIYAINDETHKGLLKIGQTSFSSLTHGATCLQRQDWAALLPI